MVLWHLSYVELAIKKVSNLIHDEGHSEEVLIDVGLAFVVGVLHGR